MLKSLVPVMAAILAVAATSAFAQNASACDRLMTTAEAYSFSSLALVRGGFGQPGPGQVGGTKGADQIAADMCADLISASTQTSANGAARVSFVFSSETCQQDLILAADGRVARDVTRVTCTAR